MSHPVISETYENNPTWFLYYVFQATFPWWSQTGNLWVYLDVGVGDNTRQLMYKVILLL